MGPGCGLSQEMNWRIWSGLRVITHHQGWGHLKTGHYMRRRVWGDQLETEEAEQSLYKTPLFQDLWAIKDHGNLLVSFTATPRILRLCQMSEPVLWCNVQSAVLPGICGPTGCLGGITHYLSLQRSWLQWTRQWWCTLTVHDITNVHLLMKCIFN